MTPLTVYIRNYGGCEAHKKMHIPFLEPVFVRSGLKWKDGVATWWPPWQRAHSLCRYKQLNTTILIFGLLYMDENILINIIFSVCHILPIYPCKSSTMTFKEIPAHTYMRLRFNVSTEKLFIFSS